MVNISLYFTHMVSDIVTNILGEKEDGHRNIISYDPRQLYYCDQADTWSPIKYCRGRCEVLFLQNCNQFEPFKDKRDVFYCLFGFNSVRKKLYKAKSEWIQGTQNRLKQTCEFLVDQFQKPPNITSM